MERLTGRNEYGFAYYKHCFRKDTCRRQTSREKCAYCEYEYNYCNKLAEYEDAEEQGLLIRLPCKAGDTVYRINPYAKEDISPVRVWKVVSTKSYDGYSNIEIYAIDMKNSGRYAFYEREINKAVFLTREEAEAALERMSENA